MGNRLRTHIGRWFIFITFRTTLAERIKQNSDDTGVPTGRLGNQQMTFSTDSKAKYTKQRDRELKKHRDERKNFIRPIKSLGLKKYVPRQ